MQLPELRLSVDNSGSTITAANNINVNAGDLNANLSGGNYLSQNLNLNAGAGTITANLDDVTGNVNSTGNAVHFNSATENLNLGTINLIDPTFYNIGNVTFTGNVDVAADLTVIATGDITDNVAGSIRITTNNNGASTTGGKLNLIAGANITSTTPATPSPSLPGGTPSTVTFNQGSITGGSINLSRVQINTSGSAGDGGDVLLAAFGGTGANSGQINYSSTAFTTSSITTGGNGAGNKNGNLTVIAPNGINFSPFLAAVNISTVGTATTGGDVRITSAQPTSTGPVTYDSTGALVSGQLVASTTLTNNTIDVQNINANGLISLQAGGNITAGDLTSATGNISAFAGVNPANTVINPAATLTLNGDITASNGSVLLEVAIT